MQASPRLTIVTGLFDLARREPAVRRQPPAEYLRHAEFLGGLTVDVVLFVDPELEQAATRPRVTGGKLGRTFVVPAPLESLPPLASLERIAAARAGNPVVNASPDKDTPLHIALTWAKFSMLEQAIALDPFEASHFAWMDFSLAGVAFTEHVAEDRLLSSPPERVRFLMLRPFRTDDLVDRHAYYEYIRGNIAGGYFSGSRENVEAVCRVFSDTVNLALDEGFAPSEEQHLPVVCSASPELCEFHHGDYRYILENFARLRGSGENLLFQMRCCRENDNYALGCDIGARVLESVRDGTFVCDAATVAALLEEYFIAAYYRNHPRQEAAAAIARAYVELIRSDASARDAFLRDEIRVRSNFAFLTEAIGL